MLRIALVSMLCCLALAPAAYADHGQSLTFEAPVDLLNPASRPGTMDEISSLGAHSLRVILYWKNVAPHPASRHRPKVDLSDPASYDWGQYDALLAAARQRGWPVLLTVSGPVPKWATKRHRDYVTNPSAKLFGQFMTAVGRHYGDQVNMWSIWNEPNHPDFLKPQYGRHHTPRSGAIYRGLFLAGWRALRATGNGRDTILMGETAPIGTGHVVAPLTFLRQALCLNDRYQRKQGCANLPATGYAHHAYTTAAGPFYKPPSPNAVTIGTLGRLEHALDRAARTGAIRRHMPIYLTEFGIQSYPDKVSGVRPGVQPQYYAISEKLAWDDKRVVSFSQYLMRDDARTGRGLGGFGGFESGLKYHNGRRKPAYDGFRLPLVVTKKAHGRVAVWGHVRPATGRTTAVVERSAGRRWRKLKTVRTDRRGYFHFRSANRKGRTWRLTWKAPDGTTYHGVRTQAYRAA